MTEKNENSAPAKTPRNARDLARHWVGEVEEGILHDFGDDEELNSLYDGQLAKDDPQRALDVALAVLDEVERRGLPPARYYSDLAADLLETTISERPEETIERVEQLARERKDFASLLGGVWRSSIPESVWQRIGAVALPLPGLEPRPHGGDGRRKRFTGSHRAPRTLRRGLDS